MKTEWGVNGERKRAADQRSERLSVGRMWKWRGLKMAVEKDTRVIQIDQMNRTNKTSIKWDINNLV